MWMRDTRTIAAVAKRVPKRAALMKPELKYYNVRYCCIHGGQAFRKERDASMPEIIQHLRRLELRHTGDDALKLVGLK